MTLPASIQRQLDQAAAIEASLAAPPQETPPIGVVVPAPETLPTGTVVSATPTVQAPAPAEPEPPAAPPAPQVDWEHKYKTIQGMYNSHVPRLQGQLKELQAQMEQLKLQLEKPAEPPKPQVDPKDSETFGADLVEMVARVTGQQFGPLVSKFEARLAKIEQSLNSTAQVASQSAEQVFLAELTKLVPDWEAVNADDRFLAWLDEADPIYNQRRQEAMNAASAAMSAPRAAAIFNAWKALVTPAPSPSPAPAPRPSLESQVAPRGSAAAAPAPAPAQSPIVTQRQIQAFYDDVARGRYRGRDAEVAQFEAVINQAVAEGRVR